MRGALPPQGSLLGLQVSGHPVRPRLPLSETQGLTGAQLCRSGSDPLPSKAAEGEGSHQLSAEDATCLPPSSVQKQRHRRDPPSVLKLSGGEKPLGKD